jgi:hypothetical protein
MCIFENQVLFLPQTRKAKRKENREAFYTTPLRILCAFSLRPLRLSGILH